MIKQNKIYYVLFLLLFINFNASAKSENNSSFIPLLPVLKLLSNYFTIQPKILLMLQQSRHSSKLTLEKVTTFSNNNSPLNVAEQYLLLLTKAHLYFQKNNHRLVIQLLIKAQKLISEIPKDQFDEPLFFQSELLLAKSYARNKNFNQAYLYKEKYFKYYEKNNKKRKQQYILQLNKKYQMDKKAEENKLLKQKNTNKSMKIKQIELLQQQRKRNMNVLIGVGVIFILIIFYQYRIRSKLKKLARTDPLTGILNRNTLFYLGERLLNEVQQSSSTLSVLYFDIDYFKKINDTYGHIVGDNMLIIIAKIGCEVIRTRDILARIGGEEFVILLPEENLTEAKTVAEHLRAKIAQYDFSSLGVVTPLTVSFGVANLDQVGKIDHSQWFDSLLNAADIAMYKAKEQGRNQVVCYDKNLLSEQKMNVRN